VSDDATKPDVQYFAEDGTWVKPPGAGRVDVVLQGGAGARATAGGAGEGGGATFIDHECIPAAGATARTTARSPQDGSRGILGVMSFDAADLPDAVEVTVGKGGRPGGRDGYALIVTHLNGPERPVTVRFTLEVPDGTDPQRVLEVVNRALDDDDGLLCQWGNWKVGSAELVPVTPPAPLTGTGGGSSWTPPPGSRISVTLRVALPEPSGRRGPVDGPADVLAGLERDRGGDAGQVPDFRAQRPQFGEQPVRAPSAAARAAAGSARTRLPLIGAPAGPGERLAAGHAGRARPGERPGRQRGERAGRRGRGA
jgi:hypothetical protein